jgi:CheY-like chemotaxis protein
MHESSLTPEQRHARFLANRLERIGIQIEIEEGATSGVGVLPLTPSPFSTLERPLVAEQARFYTLRHNRIKMFDPAPLFALPALDVGFCETIASVESALRRAWAIHLRGLQEAQRWLRSLGATVLTDGAGVQLLMELPDTEGPSVRVRSLREMLLPSSGPMREISLEGLAHRIYRALPGVDDATDLALAIGHEIEQRATQNRSARTADPVPAPVLQTEVPEPESRRILVVDDERAVRLAVEDALTVRGFRVESCPDPLGGLEALRRETYDAVMIDARMPRMDGLELTATILDLPGIAALPILLLDDRPTATNRSIAQTVGAAGYLAKPAHWEDVAESLLDLLDGWGRRRFERFPLRLKVEIEGHPGLGPTLTDTVGLGGVQVQARRDVLPARTNRYRITLPGSLGAIRVDASLVYRVEEPGQTRVRLGIRFLDFPDKDEPRWIDLISRVARRAAGGQLR